MSPECGIISKEACVWVAGCVMLFAFCVWSVECYLSR
jgi:hypothetical protein